MTNKLEYQVRKKNDKGEWKDVGDPQPDNIKGWEELFKLRAESPGQYDLRVFVKEAEDENGATGQSERDS